uniref:Protein kinase domain-containing protein n=1 Tax=Salix viminalis TaxID=40686 RepID=A0A6N2L9H9_SALVM
MKSSYSPSARRTPASGVRSTSGLAPYSRTPSSYPGRSTSANDKHLGVEFQSEIRTLAQVEHLNLHEDERIVLVEYVPNGTLREHLDCEFLATFLGLGANGIDAGMHENVIDLAVRVDIAIDVAHAVFFEGSQPESTCIKARASDTSLPLAETLSEISYQIIVAFHVDLPIIHRDIKSSDTLLTANFRSKAADFGFARLAADRDSGCHPQAKTEVKERIAAKWAQSFSLVYMQAIKKFAEGDAIVILDPKPERSAANNLALEKILELALQCLAPGRQRFLN